MTQEFGFIAILSLVAVIAITFLPIPVGERQYIIFVGIVAVLVGRGLGFALDGVGPQVKVCAIVGSALMFLLSLLLYLWTADTPPGNCSDSIFCPANRLLLWAFGIFGSFSFLADQARVRLFRGAHSAAGAGGT